MLYDDENMQLKLFLFFFYAVALFITMMILGDTKLSKRALKIIYFGLGMLTMLVIILVITQQRYYRPFWGMI